MAAMSPEYKEGYEAPATPATPDVPADEVVPEWAVEKGWAETFQELRQLSLREFFIGDYSWSFLCTVSGPDARRCERPQ